jgi:hypothetical protein
MDCGADVPPDEALLVDDMFDAKIQMGLGPFAKYVDISHEPYDDDGYCAACFRRHDAAMPVDQFMQKTMMRALDKYLRDKTQQEEP